MSCSRRHTHSRTWPIAILRSKHSWCEAPPDAKSADHRASELGSRRTFGPLGSRLPWSRTLYRWWRNGVDGSVDREESSEERVVVVEKEKKFASSTLLSLFRVHSSTDSASGRLNRWGTSFNFSSGIANSVRSYVSSGVVRISSKISRILRGKHGRSVFNRQYAHRKLHCSIWVDVRLHKQKQRTSRLLYL